MTPEVAASTDTDISRIANSWRVLNGRIRSSLAELRPEDFALEARPGYWPIWAIAGHLVGTRVYWVCHILKQPGVETTPFASPDGEGWEDDLDHPRSKEELLGAIDSTWRVVERWLTDWPASRLSEVVSRRRMDGGTQWQTHQSVLARMLSHDSFHAGEISVILGIHGRGEIDLGRRSPPRSPLR
jgi:uncharacterized damage-inducible protein DinB